MPLTVDPVVTVGARLPMLEPMAQLALLEVVAERRQPVGLRVVMVRSLAVTELQVRPQLAVLVVLEVGVPSLAVVVVVDTSVAVEVAGGRLLLRPLALGAVAPHSRARGRAT